MYYLLGAFTLVFSLILSSVYRDKTNLDLGFLSDLTFFLTSFLIYKLLSHYFGPGKTELVFCAIAAPAFVFFIYYVFLLPAKVESAKLEQQALLEKEKRDAEARSAILKDAIKTALDERDAEKAGATEKGIAETPETKT